MAPKEKVAKAPAGTKAKAKAAAKEETKKDKALKKAQKGKHLDLFYIWLNPKPLMFLCDSNCGATLNDLWHSTRG